MAGFPLWLEWMKSCVPTREKPRRGMRRAAGCDGRRHRLRLELLERRALLAGDLGFLSGTVFSDQTGDGQTADDELLEGVTIQLFRDGGDMAPGGDDMLVGTQMTDAAGEYAFADLSAGRYFVQQSVPEGYSIRAGEDVVTVDITEEQAAGTLGVTIDAFESAQEVSAASNAATTDASTFDDPAVLGGERDLLVEILSGMGTVDLDSDFVGMGLLQLSSSGSATVQAEVTWDGNDGDGASLDATGLGGIDLTDASGDETTALLLEAGADQEGAQLTIQVFTDADNWSEAVVDVPDTDGEASESFCIPFADFDVAAGGGADFTNVGAIRLVLASGESSLDMQVALTGTVGPTAFDVDFANFEPLSVGDLVWSDANNNGVFDPETESGIEGVTLNLYEDTDASGDFDPAEDTLAQTTTSDESGRYRFEDVFPSTYIVQIPESEFEAGGPLVGMTSSTGNDPVPDPDDNVDNDDNGMPVADQGVVSLPLTLSTGDEPVDDGDTDPNSNLTVDFGFFSVVDIEVAKSDNLDPIVAGLPLSYTVTVTNNGTSAATGVVLTDTLPAGVAFVSATVTQGDQPTVEDGVVTANLGTLVAGGSTDVIIVVDVDPGFSGTITNTASVTSNETDTNPDNNTAAEETTVEREADLVITKTDDIDPIVPGQTLSYTLEITNNGPSEASGVTVTDMLPAGVTFVSATSSQGDSPAAAEGTVTANLGDLASGGTASVTIVVMIDSSATGTIENAASVTSATDDPNLENNSIAESTVVTPEIDLEITKGDSSDPVTAGEMLTYTLTVTNNGPADATGVTVTDTLPEGVTFSSAMASQGEEPSEIEGVVTAVLGDLAAGASATVTIIVDVGPNTFGTITNTATVAANEPETDPANNEVSEATEVEIEPASLSGWVFVDFGNDGMFDGRDVPIPGVTITLTGMDITGAEINRTTTTDESGMYAFEDLLPGTYRIEETQPGFFPDGQESVGTAGGVALDNVFEMIELEGGVEGLGYNFADLVPTLSKRQFLASSG